MFCNRESKRDANRERISYSSSGASVVLRHGNHHNKAVLPYVRDGAMKGLGLSD